MIDLSLHIYERGSGGAPSSVLLPDRVFNTYEHSITATGGFESMAVTFAATIDDALEWLANGLMRTVVVTGLDAEIVWEGYLAEVVAVFGQEQRSVSLDDMGNRLRVRYTTVLGTPGSTAQSSDTASQALYGVKDLVVSLDNSTATAAANLSAAVLAARKNPVMRPSSTAQTGDIGGVQVTLNFAGWYTAFDWLMTSSSSTTTTTTTSQVQTLTTAYNSTNAFFSTTYMDITSSGISDTEYIEADTTYREKFETLLQQGNSSNQRLAWGVYDGRRWKIAAWAGATPDTPTYQRYLGDGRIYDASGGVVEPWNVRPDSMVHVRELLDTAPVATAQDGASRYYIERVTCTISEDQVGITLEPASFDSIDARLAAMQ